MAIFRTPDIQDLAAEVARRHTALAPAIAGRWDLLARRRQRRYESQLVEVPLQQLREAVARAERPTAARQVIRS